MKNVIVLVVIFGTFLGLEVLAGTFDWVGRDAFDEVMDIYDSVNADNCIYKSASDLRMPVGTVSQVPKYNKLLDSTSTVFRNRTTLLHMHNLALSRSYFFSHMFQFANESWNFNQQPGLMYYYMSMTSFVAANPGSINGSGIFFEYNLTYANWYKDLIFNGTLQLFGPRAWRIDDYQDSSNWLREPTNSTLNVQDYGAGKVNNYTKKAWKTNQWYDFWLPDLLSADDSVRKHTYTFSTKYSNKTGEYVDNEYKSNNFFGPPSPGINDDSNLPVLFTEPYFDCGKSNKWIVTAAAPVLDKLPRYLEWDHLRRQRFVAVATADIDFYKIDFNPCAVGEGNPGPNYFQNTARCKPTTMCQPLTGWGFRRGGYECVCRPGYRYPHWQSGPYPGIDIEIATKEEYDKGFDCLRIDNRVVVPSIQVSSGDSPSNVGKRDLEAVQTVEREIEKEREKLKERLARSVETKEKNDRRFLSKRELLASANEAQAARSKKSISARYAHVHSSSADEAEFLSKLMKRSSVSARYPHDVSRLRQKRDTFDQEQYQRMQTIFTHIGTIDSENCGLKRPEELVLPGDVGYGVDKQFEVQGRTALSLANFLSNFLQNVDESGDFGTLKGDRLLHVEQLHAEVMAHVMADHRILGIGIFYDQDKYKNPYGGTRRFFAPYAFKDTTTGVDQAMSVDFAGESEHYLDDTWFKNVKMRWVANTHGLTKYVMNPLIRSNLNGTGEMRFQQYPMFYEAASYEDGMWSAPYFDCDGFVNDWVITYSVPFFGSDALRTGALEFKGVVIVDVRLDYLDINQCPGEFWEPNAFKDTARCHFETTTCAPVQGKRFNTGAYRCECKQGYEYQFIENAWFFDGETVEAEYEKQQKGEFSKFNVLKCRTAGASIISSSWIVLVALLSLMTAV